MASTKTGGIEFLLLGPVEAVLNGRALPLGGRRQRALLALLLLEPGRPVSAERLADELWNGAPPTGAATTVRAYVSKLRGVLGAAAAVTGGVSGYALEVAPELVDARRFEGLVREGREALERRAARRAAESLRAALDLWHGCPFGDLGGEGALRVEADRLEALRLLAHEERIEADLALGQGAELVDEGDARAGATSRG